MKLNDIFKHKNKDTDIDDKYFRPDGEYCTRDYLDSMLSPLIQKQFDMKYNGTYTWYGPWNQHMRKVITVFLLKGDRGILEWGYNFDFLPELTSGQIKYFRTEKRVKTQLRDFPKPFIDFGNWDDYVIPMHSNNLHQLENRITKVWNLSSLQILDWFERVASIDAALAELEYQISYQNYYTFLAPEQAYMKAFLTAMSGNESLAVEILKNTNIFLECSSEKQEMLIGKLRELGGRNEGSTIIDRSQFNCTF